MHDDAARPSNQDTEHCEGDVADGKEEQTNTSAYGDGPEARTPGLANCHATTEVLKAVKIGHAQASHRGRS
jgi:hypothetical protein